MPGRVVIIGKTRPPCSLPLHFPVIFHEHGVFLEKIAKLIVLMEIHENTHLNC